MAKRAIVIGGSISGLFAAILLRKQGWDVDVFERSDVELKGRGAGIITHPQLHRILDEIGAKVEDLGIEVEGRIYFDRAGNIISRFPFPQIQSSWDRLHSFARELQVEADHHLNHNFIGFDQDAGGVTAYFENGQSTRGDILIAADGFRSAVRGIVAPEVQAIYAGYVIWRAVINEADMDAETHAAIFQRLPLFVAPGHQVAGYPIPGSDNNLKPGHRRWSFSYYRNTPAEKLHDMLTDESGHTHDMSIPPPLIRAEVIKEMRDTAETVLTLPMLKALRQFKTTFFTPIYDHASPSMIFGRVVLIGDSAFVARPHTGMGATKGAADAKALADALGASGDDIDAGLQAFNAVRKPLSDKMVAKGRELGEFLREDFPGFLPDGTLDEPHRDMLIRETATDLFLYR